MLAFLLLLASPIACAPLLGRIPAVVDVAHAASAARAAPVAERAASAAQPDVPVQQASDALPGRILYVRDGNLWLWQGGNSRQFTDGGTWYQPAYSPDGSEIAYVYWTYNFSDIFVMSADGVAARRLTRGQASNLIDNEWAFRPRWSPDGSQLAYVSDGSTTFPVVWLMKTDGSGRHQLMTTGYGIDWADAISWSPDSKRLAISAGPTSPGTDPGQIYLMDAAKGTFEKLTSHTNGSYDPAWGPDGDTIAYVARTAPGGELWLRSIDGTREAHVSGLPYVRSPVWSPDGKSLAVLAARGGAFQIWTMSVRATDSGFEIGEPRQLTKDGSLDASSGLTWTR